MIDHRQGRSRRRRLSIIKFLRRILKLDSELNIQQEIEKLKPRVDEIKQDLAVAQTIAEIGMHPESAEARIQAEELRLKSLEEYKPPREVVIYVVRYIYTLLKTKAKAKVAEW